MSQVGQLYDRICSLDVYGTVESPAGPNGTNLTQLPARVTFSSKQNDGSPGFRIKFNIQLVTGDVPVPNPAVIHIYNLGQSSRKILGQLNNVIELKAGYGSNAQIIFKGNLQYCVTRKEGPDYVTEIHASDGMYAFQNSLINKSFGQSTTVSQVMTTLTQALSGAGVQTGQIKGVPTSQYNKGIVLSGKTVDKLRDFCSANGLNWTIEQGKLNVVPFGASLDKPVIILSPSTGLIGIPQQREIDVNGASLISFKCLLNPSIGTFNLIFLNSKFVNGLYTTAKVTHVGDTFAQDWYTQGECT